MSWTGPSRNDLAETMRKNRAGILAMIQRDRTTPDALSQLVDSPSVEMIAAAAGHPNLGQESIEKLIALMVQASASGRTKRVRPIVTALAANRHLDPPSYERLAQVLAGGYSTNALDALYQNPGFPQDLIPLGTLSHARACKLLQRPNLESEVIRQIWRRYVTRDVGELVYAHANAPIDVALQILVRYRLSEIYKPKEEPPRELDPRYCDDPAILVRLARTIEWDDLPLLLDNPSLSSDAFRIATYRAAGIPTAYRLVLRHPNCPRDILEPALRATYRSQWNYRCLLAGATQLSAAEQLEFSFDRSLQVRAALAANPALDREVALHLAESAGEDNAAVAAALALNDACPVDLLQILADTSPHVEARTCAQLNLMMQGLRVLAREAPDADVACDENQAATVRPHSGPTVGI